MPARRSSSRACDSDDDDDSYATAALVQSPLLRLLGAGLAVAFRPVRELFFLLSWLIWLFSSVMLNTGHVSIVLYSAIRITISLGLYLIVLAAFRVHAAAHALYTWGLCWTQRHIPRAERIRIKKQQLRKAETLQQWQTIALQLDKLCGHIAWKASAVSPDYDYKLLKQVNQELMRCRQLGDWRGLLFHLSNVLHRQFCSMHNERLYSFVYHGTKHAIESFYCNVVEQLSFLCTTDFGPEFTTRAKLRFFQRARRTLGKTALCLSGGGALAMYHTGVCRALVRGNCLPSIISGTSGGAIIAALVCTRNDAELREPDFLSPTICTRYGAENRWLPTLQQQVDSFVKNRVLMDHRVFQRSAQVIFGEALTFEAAYRHTQRELNITVVTSSGQVAGKPHPLILNHISAPSVLIWSAVTCSCALPGLMTSQTLMCLGPDGTRVPYYPSDSGVEVVDGSLQADIPVQRLSELFNAQSFVVSQTNPHVRDFVRDGLEGCGSAAAPAMLGPRSRVFEVLSGFDKFLRADIGHRLRRLAKLKVIPKIYGQDFSQVLSGSQQYTGDVTIVPRIPFLMRFKALTHPSPDDMAEYLRGGEAAAYPKISRIQNGLLLERTLEACVRSLSAQLKREQRHRTRRHQRHSQAHAEMRATTHDHVDQPVQPQPPHAAAPAAAGHHQSSPVLSSAPATPRRMRKVSGDGALTDALQAAASGSRNINTPSNALHPHHGTGAASLLTPTAAVLAQLPMHGACDATDTDGDATDSVAESARARLLRVASRAHHGHSHGQPRVEEETEASGPLSEGSDDDPLLHSDSAADLSDHSTATAASLADWDAEEEANHELETTAVADEQHTHGHGHGHALLRYQAEASRRTAEADVVTTTTSAEPQAANRSPS